MEWYFVLTIVIGVILFILFCPLCFKFRFYVNILQNLGAVSTTVFGITLKAFQFELTKKGYNIFNKQKISQKKFNLRKIIFAQKLCLVLFAYIKISKIFLNTEFGYKRNAMVSSLANGSFITLLNDFLFFLHTKKESATMFCAYDVDFERDSFKILGYSSIILTPISVIFSIIAVLIISIKEQKNGK